MQYSLGSQIADYGFCFFENIHEPIFLVNKSGMIVKGNEAARKFLRIAGLSSQQISNWSRERLSSMDFSKQKLARFKIGKCGLQCLVKSLRNSEYLLIEVQRRYGKIA